MPHVVNRLQQEGVKREVTQIATFTWLQGAAVMLPRQGLSAEGVYDAFTRVLTDDSYQAAAAKLSKRIRSRKRTPLKEAAGEPPEVQSIALLSTTHQPEMLSLHQGHDVCLP